MIPFNKPFVSGTEQEYISKAVASTQLAGNGPFGKECELFLEDLIRTPKVLMTSSCTHALEMCAMLLNIEEGDEIILPSFTFVSAANAFVLRGAKMVFVDIDPETCNIDPNCIEKAITPKTKAIMVMHYGGKSCNMDLIMPIAEEHGLYVIEDAAHCIDSRDNSMHLGVRGHLACLSFHATKNIQCGEGGALIINDSQFIERAEILREKGTNRKQFLDGLVDKYSWVDIGSSYLMSEITAAFLLAQLQHIQKVSAKRRALVEYYSSALSSFFDTEMLFNPAKNSNGHLFYLRTNRRSKLQGYLKSNGVQSSFHYVPLHTSSYGIKTGRFEGEDKYTTKVSSELLRLPLYYDLKEKDQEIIVRHIIDFEKSKNT